MSRVELALIVFAVAISVPAFLAMATTLIHYRRRRPITAQELRRKFPAGLPLVSILKPCKGADPGLYDNLASFMKLEGVPYEVIIGVADPKDPAANVARRLIRDFPGRSVRLVITSDRRAYNPKVVNLEGLEHEARGELVVVSDSNVRVEPTFLQHLLLPFADPKVGLSYALFQGVPAPGLGSRMQAAVFATVVIPALIAAYRITGVANLVGKAFMLRRSVIEELGGWKRYERHLAEDALMGQDLRKAGWKIALVPHVVKVMLGEFTLPHLWSQELRWSVLHRLIAPMVPVGQIAWSPAVLAMLSLASYAFDMKAAAAVLAVVSLANFVNLRVIPYLRFGGPVRDLWMLSGLEYFMLGIVTSVWFHDDVIWRGQRFVLGKDTLVLSSELLSAPAVPAMSSGLGETTRRAA